MRTMLKVTLPVEAANKAIKDGSLPRIMESTMNELRPESAYFYAENGKRTALMVFDLTKGSFSDPGDFGAVLHGAQCRRFLRPGDERRRPQGGPGEGNEETGVIRGGIGRLTRT